jgi:hypothetical protein
MMSFLPWGGRPSCPANPDEKKLVEDGFLYLSERIGLDRLRKTTVIEPTPQFFPDRYDASMEATEQMFARVCGYMGIEPASVGLGSSREKKAAMWSKWRAISAVIGPPKGRPVITPDRMAWIRFG